MTGAWQQPLPAMPAPPPASAWQRLPVPDGYATQWRRLVDAALELGIGPDDLASGGLETIAGNRDWKPATVALYTKVARYGGLALPLVRTPEPQPTVLDLRPLTELHNDDPEHLRSVVWCALALGWPATVGQFRDLRRENVRSTGKHLLVCTDDGRWTVTGARTAWYAWETTRARFPALAQSPWVLPALRRGPGMSSVVGGRLSTQALQVTFAKHAVRTAQALRASVPPSRRSRAEELAAAYLTLSYDSYRRLALAGGAAPVASRGAVRATRAARALTASGRSRP